MTIEFRCPGCSQLCGFREQQAGRRARCLKCGQLFLIPSTGEKAQKVKTVEREDGPIGGFYRAVWKLPRDLDSLTGVLFLVALAFGFFLVRHMNYSMSFFVPATGGIITILLPLGLITATLLLGMILHYDMEILRYTAFDLDSLPEEELGDIFGFIAVCVRGLYTFFICASVAGLPAMLTWLALNGLAADGAWPLYAAIAAGLLMLPAITAAVAMSGDLLCVLRPDLYGRVIRKALRPYLFTCLIFIPCAVALFFLYPKGLAIKQGPWMNLLYFAGHLAAALLSAFTARVIGLFCRHYYCYLL